MQDQAQGGNPVLCLAPIDLVAVQVVADDLLLTLDPIAGTVTRGGSQLGFGFEVIGDEIELAPVVDDLLGVFGAAEDFDRCAGCRVEHGDGSTHAQRYVNPLAVNNEPPGDVGRPGLESEHVGNPRVDVPFPEDRSVESIPGDEFPGARKQRGEGVAFVEDVEDFTVTADAGRDTAHDVVMTRPARTTRPLTVEEGRAKERVLADRGAGGVVEILRPLIHFGWSRFGDHISSDDGLSQGGQRAHNLGAGDGCLCVGGKHVDEVRDHRETLAVPGAHRDSVSQARLVEVFAMRIDLVLVLNADVDHGVRDELLECCHGRDILGLQQHDNAAFEVGEFDQFLRVDFGCYRQRQDGNQCGADECPEHGESSLGYFGRASRMGGLCARGSLFGGPCSEIRRPLVDPGWPRGPALPFFKPASCDDW